MASPFLVAPPAPHEDAGAAAPGQRWSLRRNCSLSPRQVLCLYLSLTALSLTFATVFALHGLWMVLPFSVLENTALGAALLYYARHALDRDHVRIEGDRVIVDVVRCERVARHEFQIPWVRVQRGGRWGERVSLRQGASEVAVGTQVGIDRRRAFAAELQQALRARR